MGQKVIKLLICLCFHHTLGHTVLLLSAHGFSLFKDPRATVEDRVEDLLSLMTLEEKLGQMVQIDCTVANASVIQRFFVGMYVSTYLRGKLGNTSQDLLYFPKCHSFEFVVFCYGGVNQRHFGIGVGIRKR